MDVHKANQASAFRAWSEAIAYAIKYGGTADDIRRSAVNIGSGMMLNQSDIQKVACFFNWSMIEDATSKPSMAINASKSE